MLGIYWYRWICKNALLRAETLLNSKKDENLSHISLNIYNNITLLGVVIVPSMMLSYKMI